MCRSNLLGATLVLVGLLWSQQAVAQVPFVAPSAEKLFERLSDDAENARWTWGTFRVQPSIGLGNVQYIDDVFVDSDVQGQPIQSDLTVSAFAGLNLYQLLGERSAFAVSARPSYSWWQDLSERSRFNLDAEAAAALASGRLFLDARIARAERLGTATEEAEQQINFRSDIADVSGGFEIYRSLAFIATYSRDEREHLLDEQPSALVPDFRRLDETTDTVVVGLRVEPGRNATLSIGVVELETDSANTGRDFDGTGYQAEFSLSRDVLEVTARIRELELRPLSGASFEQFDLTSGHLAIRLGSADGRNVTLFADQGLNASVRTNVSDFESTRYGIRSTTRIGRRAGLLVGYEEGRRDYRGSTRKDDTQLAFAGLTFELVGGVALTSRFSRSKLESTESNFDREFDRFTIGLTVGLSGFRWP